MIKRSYIKLSGILLLIVGTLVVSLAFFLPYLLDINAYRDEILALARERRKFGRDRLDMGVPVIIDSAGNKGFDRVKTDAYVDWSRSAALHGNRRLAFRYARSALRAGPLAVRAWVNMARVLFKVSFR
jgi:hypothetical protein